LRSVVKLGVVMALRQNQLLRFNALQKALRGTFNQMVIFPDHLHKFRTQFEQLINGKTKLYNILVLFVHRAS
jgi:hypothetical protein